MCSEQLFNGKTLDRLREEFPILRAIEARQETTWINDRKLPFAQALAECPLTMEDILEAIVGDIEDEYDTEERDIFYITDGLYHIDGTADLEDVQEELDIHFTDADDDYDTIGGYLTDRLGRLPGENETPSVDACGYRFRVMQVKEHRIHLVEARKLSAEELKSESE